MEGFWGGRKGSSLDVEGDEKVVQFITEHEAVHLQYFLLIYLLRQEEQKNSKQMGLYQTEKVFHSRGNHPYFKRKLTA